MDERRRHKRFTVEGIEGTLQFSTDVDILNISVSGAALKAGRRLEIGREYTLKLEYRDDVISLNGVVVWSVLSELGSGPHEEKVPVYKAGMRFTNVISEKMEKLLDFIDRNKLRALDDRLTIRFDVISPDKASLNAPHSYTVTKLSRGGMLIQMDVPLEPEETFRMDFCLQGDAVIRVLGRVASCIEISDTTPKHYDIGIEFLEIAESDRVRFEEFIERLL
ncbi:MAG: PilZ domain-containing protein [Nitrospirae bacterium]|nr:PilZ domain-containing protein [Nitrospirota bacterium]